jgi:hypothetical protein
MSLSKSFQESIVQALRREDQWWTTEYTEDTE